MHDGYDHEVAHNKAPSGGDNSFDETAREENVKHLEMIQAIISRLAGNSFLIKAWTVTVAAAAYGIAVNRLDWRICIIGTLAVAEFWVLDSYFLRQERIFRLLYDYVRSDIRAMPRFSMATTRFRSRVHRHTVFFSITLSVLYGTLIAIGITLAIVAGAIK
ncbi:MAG TPA: hypothetical protein VJT72_16410 [Pseudonocardiaceae bacterium]|nr:hypothetical protein [Pseudonocardiaceae bacterium]